MNGTTVFHFYKMNTDYLLIKFCYKYVHYDHMLQQHIYVSKNKYEWSYESQRVS